MLCHHTSFTFSLQLLIWSKSATSKRFHYDLYAFSFLFSLMFFWFLTTTWLRINAINQKNQIKTKIKNHFGEKISSYLPWQIIGRIFRVDPFSEIWMRSNADQNERINIESDLLINRCCEFVETKMTQIVNQRCAWWNFHTHKKNQKHTNLLHKM